MTYTAQAGGVSETSLERAYELARTAIALDDSLPQVHWAMTDVRLFRRQYAEALTSSEKSTELDPNYADAYAQRAWLLMYVGKPNEALEVLDKAMRLNPHYPFVYLNPLGESYFTLRRYQEAIDAFREGLTRNPTAQRQRMFLAATYAQVDRVEDAQWEVAELLTLDPDFSLAQVAEVAPFKDPEPLNRLLDGLRKAGLT
jgi:tetratricopeptide (TPR) repeat protein